MTFVSRLHVLANMLVLLALVLVAALALRPVFDGAWAWLAACAAVFCPLAHVACRLAPRLTAPVVDALGRRLGPR